MGQSGSNASIPSSIKVYRGRGADSDSERGLSPIMVRTGGRVIAPSERQRRRPVDHRSSIDRIMSLFEDEYRPWHQYLDQYDDYLQRALPNRTVRALSMLAVMFDNIYNRYTRNESGDPLDLVFLTRALRATYRQYEHSPQLLHNEVRELAQRASQTAQRLARRTRQRIINRNQQT